MNELLALLGLGGGGLLVKEAYDKLGEAGDTAWDQSQRIGQDTSDAVQFQGYGVTGPGGFSTVDASGNVNYGLSPEQQQYADAMRIRSLASSNATSPLGQYGRNALQAGSGLLDSITQGSDGREQEYYNKLRALQAPEEARQRLGLESRLAAQGRTGIRSGMYGGTPEQLAMEKAHAEAQNTSAMQAIELARQAQAQDANIYGMLGQAGIGALGQAGNLAGQYGQLQYAPQSALLDAFQGGTQAYGYEDIARRQGASLYGEAQMGGLEGLLGSRLGQANLMGHLGSGLLGGGMNILSGILGGYV